MNYIDRHPIIKAIQFLDPGNPPPQCGFTVEDTLVVRTSDMSHATVKLRDYVVYPPTERDEDGEPTYPEVWQREHFERMLEPVEDSTFVAVRALKNYGADVTCGACMEIAFSGSTVNQHTCGRTERVTITEGD